MKKIVVAFISLALVFSLCACGHSNEDTTRINDSNPFTVYLKWSDGEEELHPYKVRYHQTIATLYFEGYSIDTSYENVIIYDYR